MKIVCISDTHSMHERVELPEGDVLVHAGDLTGVGAYGAIETAIGWLNQQPHKHIVCIAGNHDLGLERKPQQWWDGLDWGRVVYLENSSINIDGLTFWGSPVTPAFCDWAFNVPRGAPIREVWRGIPEAGLVDVLITHGPPMGILDQARPARTLPSGVEFEGSEHLGCEDLAHAVTVAKPLLHVFGHIHGGYGQRTLHGTEYVNASQVNEAYRVVNKPIVVEIER